MCRRQSTATVRLCAFGQLGSDQREEYRGAPGRVNAAPRRHCLTTWPPLILQIYSLSILNLLHSLMQAYAGEEQKHTLQRTGCETPCMLCTRDADNCRALAPCGLARLSLEAG